MKATTARLNARLRTFREARASNCPDAAAELADTCQFYCDLLVRVRDGIAAERKRLLTSADEDDTLRRVEGGIIDAIADLTGIVQACQPNEPMDTGIRRNER